MKNIKSLFIVTIFLTLICCTEENQAPEENQVPEEINTIEKTSIFKIEVNGVELLNTNVIIHKTENNFLLKLGSLSFTFNKQGHFGHCIIPLQTSPTELTPFISFRPFSSNYFTFNLESVDEVNRRVKGTFSGYIFRDKFNLNSESKYIRGNFDSYYEVLAPAVFGLKNEAKINGNQFIRVDGILEEGDAVGDFNRITETNYNQDEFKIILNLNIIPSFGEGTYNFINTTTVNNLKIARFDPITTSYINYDTNGSLIITKKEGYIYTGTYSFTAVNPNNPNDLLQVTDGSFKLVNKFL